MWVILFPHPVEPPIRSSRSPTGSLTNMTSFDFVKDGEDIALCYSSNQDQISVLSVPVCLSPSTSVCLSVCLSSLLLYSLTIQLCAVRCILFYKNHYQGDEETEKKHLHTVNKRLHSQMEKVPGNFHKRNNQQEVKRAAVLGEEI